VGYSEEFKKTAVQKLLTRGNRTDSEIIEELGIASPTIYQWRNELARVPGMKKPTSPKTGQQTKNLKFSLNTRPFPRRREENIYARMVFTKTISMSGVLKLRRLFYQ
jgi:transposase-like protein